MTGASSMHEAGQSGLVLCDNLKGGGGEEDGGRGFRMRGHMYVYGQFTLMYGKSHHNIVK